MDWTKLETLMNSTPLCQTNLLLTTFSFSPLNLKIFKFIKGHLRSA